MEEFVLLNLGLVRPFKGCIAGLEVRLRVQLGSKKVSLVVFSIEDSHCGVRSLNAVSLALNLLVRESVLQLSVLPLGCHKGVLQGRDLGQQGRFSDAEFLGRFGPVFFEDLGAKGFFTFIRAGVFIEGRARMSYGSEPILEFGNIRNERVVLNYKPHTFLFTGSVGA